MFTGIVEGVGVVKDIRPSADRGKRLGVEAGFDMEDVAVGDSIAVSGACLTVVEVNGRMLWADVAPETLSKTTLGMMRAGERVNLERALRFSDRLGGHLVTGHVDGTGIVESIKKTGNAVILTIGVSSDIGLYMVTKGSVAVDGVSLTINECDRSRVVLSIIPHTAAVTTIGIRRVGDKVNIETDIIGKYVRHFLVANGAKENGKNGGGIDADFLVKTGFL
ncbi:MAG: riboflavin synthase [Desulfococcus sp. 4484_241]|nr:MAG: riboflavin synthase [Desulfococcus sp. 4484_241]